LGATTRRSLFINPGAITQNTAAATGMYSGLDITLPALTLTSGTALTANGIRVNTDGLTQTAGALTSNGLLVDSTSSTITTGGTINGIKISAPTTIPSVGTYNSIFLGTSTSSTANSHDQATISVGNIASTAQNNFSTLNLTNGGSGFLDIEVMRGFMNFQGMNTLSDDFTGRVLDTTNTWTSTVTGGATACAILSGGVNGLFRMTTGNAASRGCELTTQVITTLTNGYFQRGNNPIFETKLKIDTLANARISAGFTNTRVAVAAETNASTHHAYIVKRAADTTWQCVTDDGGAVETTTDTGVTIVANTFYRLRVALRNGTTPETICTVDDGTTVTRTVVTATQPGATSPMDVYVRDNQSDAVVKNMDVDYVRAWQDDPPALTINDTGALESTIASDKTDSLSQEEVSPSATPTPEVAVEADTSVNFITETISKLLKNMVDFFGNVIFHGDVSFLGHATVNKDTADHAVIMKGDDEINVVFEKEYINDPVVTASVNLSDGIKSDEIPHYAVYDITTKGFKIKLSEAAPIDLTFSWIALAVSKDDKATKSVSDMPTSDPAPSQPSQTILPVISSVIPVIESASLSAQMVH